MADKTEGFGTPATRISGTDSRYLSTLDPEDRNRFQEKLRVSVANGFVDIKNPYEMWNVCHLWSDEPTRWPDISFGDLWIYLIDKRGPFNAEKLKRYKSLEAYQYFVSRKVGVVYSYEVRKDAGVFVLKAEVRPGQAESQTSHLCWLIAKSSGEIITTHCDCKAGLGETCSHVTAVMFKVEAAVRIGLTSAACTSEACRWNRVFGNNSLTAPVEEIDFKPAKRRESEPRASPGKDDCSPLACRKGGPDYLEAYQGFLAELAKICPNACIFKSLPKLDPEETDTAESDGNDSEEESGQASVISAVQHNFEVSVSPSVSVGEVGEVSNSAVPQAPPPFPLNGEKVRQWAPISDPLSPMLTGYLKLLQLTYDKARELEVSTQKQAECPQWHELRYPRLTASTFGNICSKMESSRAKPGLVAKHLLQPKPHTAYTNRMLKWGRENEHIAIQVYKGLPERNHVSVYECGIYISPEDPYLAATPDRVCYDPREKNPWGIIEVKCPFKARDTCMTPTEASQQLNNFMSTIKDGALDLSTTHDYYLQIQGQMALTGATWCDFVIYTKKGVSVQRIQFDERFWESKARLLSSFFVQYFLPKYIELKEHSQR